jgi:hypothetical protein
MSNTETPDSSSANDRWDESRRRQLLSHHSKRSDEAANFLRAALFALATVAGGFLVKENYEKPFNSHDISLVLFATAIGLIVYSWDYQKKKSLRRVRSLEANKWREEYRTLQNEIKTKGKNQTIDRWAAGLIFAGFAVEVVIKFDCLYGK